MKFSMLGRKRGRFFSSAPLSAPLCGHGMTEYTGYSAASVLSDGMPIRDFRVRNGAKFLGTVLRGLLLCVSSESAGKPRSVKHRTISRPRGKEGLTIMLTSLQVCSNIPVAAA